MLLQEMINQIRNKLSNYLDGDISLQNFQSWFVPIEWLVDPLEADLCASISLVLAEYSNGDWTPEELRKQLRQICEGIN